MSNVRDDSDKYSNNPPKVLPADNEKLSDTSDSENNSLLSADAFLLTATAIAAIAGFLYGYDTGIISGALLQITHDFSLSSHAQELVTSATLVGAVVWVLSCGKLSSMLGRRYTVMIVAAIFALGVAAIYLALTMMGKLLVDRIGRRTLTLYMTPARSSARRCCDV
ncbi:MFS transporter [Lonsdalea populi]|uniref:MFS transporter n=1 Tax=Lonsdalea populi TaxID=1172565 RepID=UPI000A225806|nr:MFS transporter [Lonsdalea populi]OSM94227.1 hypothetical protein AU508_14980 [Lonsdalea populi]RAT72473.1 hypothetical protein AU505_06810 [Lonsdalea populi]RAT72551.1 hypothetical protein AU504_02950 [Lonsdalea populi]RAT74417.1 hypothetical protein AU506_12350 [Lonsdalea populi]RAT78355.1 hypothetical protein AU507_09445 [Lonsdalea populi]